MVMGIITALEAVGVSMIHGNMRGKKAQKLWAWVREIRPKQLRYLVCSLPLTDCCWHEKGGPSCPNRSSVSRYRSDTLWSVWSNLWCRWLILWKLRKNSPSGSFLYCRHQMNIVSLKVENWLDYAGIDAVVTNRKNSPEVMSCTKMEAVVAVIEVSISIFKGLFIIWANCSGMCGKI